MSRVERVPQADLTRQVEGLMDELLAAAGRVIMSGRYILGPEVEAFEAETARYLGVGDAVAVGNGTDALVLALKAVGIGPGDRVLTTPFTFFATASAVLAAGAEPVFADIDRHTFNLDPEQARLVIESDSSLHRRIGVERGTIRAILPVHLYGRAAELGPLLALAEEHGLFVIEDAAQAFGSAYAGRKVGGVGHMGCFSFFPSKNLGGFGDGGLVTTDDGELAERVRLLRAHGASERNVHRVAGINSRLDALQAALLRVKLRHVDTWLAARRRHAAAYDAVLRVIEDIEPPRPAPAGAHTYHQYTVRVSERRRDALRRSLLERGVETSVYYPLPLHLQPALVRMGYQKGDLAHSEQASREVLSLPMFPEMRRDELDHVTACVRDFLRPG